MSGLQSQSERAFQLTSLAGDRGTAPCLPLQKGLLIFLRWEPRSAVRIARTAESTAEPEAESPQGERQYVCHGEGEKGECMLTEQTSFHLTADDSISFFTDSYLTVNIRKHHE